MTTEKKLIQPKMGLLKLAEKVCKFTFVSAIAHNSIYANSISLTDPVVSGT
jgi:hypothetical protein